MQERDLERAVRAWVADGPEQLPDPHLDAAVSEIATTPQRGAGWLLRIFPMLNNPVPLWTAAAVTLVAAAILGLSLLPGNIGVPTRPTPNSTPIVTPTATPAATLSPEQITAVSGRFEAEFGAVEIQATGVNGSVSGSMEVSTTARRRFTVDFRCSETNDNGVVLIAGPVTKSTHPQGDPGDRIAIAIRPGEPAGAILWLEDRPRAPGCRAFLERVPDDIADFLEPVEGQVEFGI